MSEQFPFTTVFLKLDEGTLYAVPNGGQVRLDNNTDLVLNASFPFSVQISALTGSYPLPAGGSACPTGNGYSFAIQLRGVLDVPSAPTAPSFKYTITGDGDAAGKILDPIIIVDKK